MKKLQFKTSINCKGCVAAVTPFLDSIKSVESWSVDTNHKDKILTVEGSDPNAKEVVDAVRSAGYQINEIDEAG